MFRKDLERKRSFSSGRTGVESLWRDLLTDKSSFGLGQPMSEQSFEQPVSNTRPKLYRDTELCSSVVS
jgi:hypothetical protein